MKSRSLFLTLGMSAALLGAGVLSAADMAQAAQKRVNFKSGNWNKRAAARHKAPPRQIRLRNPIEFFNIFRPRRQPVRAPQQPQPPAQFPGQFAPRQLAPFPPAGRAVPVKARKKARPVLIAPDTQVEEYVEKPKIYVYPQPQLLPLRNASLGGAPASPQAAAILNVLRSGAARVEVSKANRRAILAFYKARNFAPVWLTGGDVSMKGQNVLGLLARAHEHGLNDAHYRVPVVWENNGDASAIAGDARRLARLDVELTAMALRYARHLSGGVVNPNEISSYHDLRPPKVSAPLALKKLATANNPATWLESLAPRHFAYRQMKRALARLGNAGEANLLPPIPRGKLIRPGMRDDRLALIRQHLRKLGLLGANGGSAGSTESAAPVKANPTAGDGGDTPNTDSASLENAVYDDTQASANSDNAALVYDKSVERAVRKFQRMAGLKPDGLIGNGTVRALNRRNSGNSKKARIAKLKLNMERMRWMPRKFGNPHFLVNVPAFEAYLYQDGKVRWKSRVIVGKPKNQTAFFSDQIEYVEFNPYWRVPQSIIRKELIPKLLKDPAWLDKHGYEVKDQKGRVISSTVVDWARWQNAKHIPFDVRQLPGDKNALGRLKVMFPNRHAIYMHDTPFKGLFSRRTRAFSHGCVRVRKPRELAELVSGLDPFEIENYLKAQKNKQIKVPKKIPVHIAYFTAWPDDAGKMHYYADIYGRDRLLQTALKKHDAAYRRLTLKVGLR